MDAWGLSSERPPPLNSITTIKTGSDGKRIRCIVLYKYTRQTYFLSLSLSLLMVLFYC